MPKINRVCVLAVPALLLATACPDLSLAQNVRIWMTTDNQKTKLKQQPSISFSAGSSGSTPTVFVDETEGYQSIEGFGASFTDSAAYLLNEKVPASQLNSVMTSLFDHTNGIGVSFVRNPMGASDLTRYDYSYDDMSAGQTDPNLTNFSIAHDLVDIVPLVKLTTKILIYDHNWDRPDYPKTVLSNSQISGSGQIAGIAWHGYGGTPGAMSALQEAFPALGNYETEHSGGTWVSDQVKADFEEITQRMRKWGKSYIKLRMHLTQNP